MIIMNVATAFKQLRTSKEFSVYKLSKISDISENYIHKIEKGQNQPSVYVLETLLGCLGTTLAEFFNEGNDVLYPTPFERELVESVRVLDEEKASAVLHIAKLMSK